MMLCTTVRTSPVIMRGSYMARKTALKASYSGLASGLSRTFISPTKEGLNANPHITTNCRHFSSTTSVHKKKHSASSQSSSFSSIEQEDESTDFLANLEADFTKVIDLFKEKAKHVKSGNADLVKWQNLKIETKNKASEPLKSLANIQIKGSGKRLIEIVAFDPKDVKHIQSSVLKEFNINAQADPKNKQSLLVSLQNKDSKDEAAKLLKALHDEFRNAKHGTSLSVVRANVLNKIKKSKDLSKDESKSLMNKVEKVYKDFSTQLADALKKLEAN